MSEPNRVVETASVTCVTNSVVEDAVEETAVVSESNWVVAVTSVTSVIE